MLFFFNVLQVLSWSKVRVSVLMTNPWSATTFAKEGGLVMKLSNATLTNAQPGENAYLPRTTAITERSKVSEEILSSQHRNFLLQVPRGRENERPCKRGRSRSRIQQPTFDNRKNKEATFRTRGTTTGSNFICLHPTTFTLIMFISSCFEMRQIDLTLVGILDKCYDMYQCWNCTLITKLL